MAECGLFTGSLRTSASPNFSRALGFRAWLTFLQNDKPNSAHEQPQPVPGTQGFTSQGPGSVVGDGPGDAALAAENFGIAPPTAGRYTWVVLVVATPVDTAQSELGLSEALASTTDARRSGRFVVKVRSVSRGWDYSGAASGDPKA